jgi:hypothetical protein
MSDEELELLITLDDPGDGPEEDIFNHLQSRNNLEYWLSQRFRFDQRAEVTTGDDAYNVTHSN